MYLYGRHFSLLTDHKPLVSIFHPQKGVPLTTAARLQRYALFLSGLDYSIEYRNTAQHGNADGLSHMVLPLTGDGEDEEAEFLDSAHVFHIAQLEALPVSADEVKRRTARDPVLARVYEATMRGWNDSTDQDLQPYFSRRNEITVHQGCLLWGIRVIIPEPLKQDILLMIHEGHLGMVKMKSLARSHVWWSGIDAEIEEYCKKCSGCNENRNLPPETPIHPWEYPEKPWQRIHVDFAGPFMSAMFLIVVYAHSKWPEVIKMNKTTASKTIEVLRTIFARNGLPEHLLNDNGPQFVADEFRHFMKSNGIRHTTSAPYHPKTNGLAERFVQTFKNAMKASKGDEGSLQKKLCNFLIAYRKAPQQATGETPARLFVGKHLTTKIDRLRPDVTKTVAKNQDRMREKISSPPRQCSVGDSVLVRDYRGDQKWTRGVVSEQTGPVSYKVDVTPRSEWRRHTDQIIKSAANSNDAPVQQPDVETHLDVPESIADKSLHSTQPPQNTGKSREKPETTSNPKTPIRQNPPRNRRAPEKLNL
ncbi:uncharacterized protein K02A2.6-like [Ostrea edulis]|uniref:uncharacterized protein K02A2.6-like n=1 Tax=Ostrea edulis TaxID=37623 RepID=UPI0024AF44F9|nr:uncharacterized protein K02A2.6-like [Ostrea edulis]